MPAYVVKHIATEQGPLSAIMKEVKKTPYSYSSKEPEALDAAQGADIYVIEVLAEKAKRTYWLGYRYRAYECFTLAGKARWKDEFKYKNSAKPMENPIGVYFEQPILIEDASVREWLSNKQPGMAEVPPHLIEALELIIKNPSNNAKRFA